MKIPTSFLCCAFLFALSSHAQNMIYNGGFELTGFDYFEHKFTYNHDFTNDYNLVWNVNPKSRIGFEFLYQRNQPTKITLSNKEFYGQSGQGCAYIVFRGHREPIEDMQFMYSPLKSTTKKGGVYEIKLDLCRISRVHGSPVNQEINKTYGVYLYRVIPEQKKMKRQQIMSFSDYYLDLPIDSFQTFLDTFVADDIYDNIGFGYLYSDTFGGSLGIDEIALRALSIDDFTPKKVKGPQQEPKSLVSNVSVSRFSLFYGTGMYVLTEEQINELKARFQDYKGVKLKVILKGYSDAIGREEDNITLSKDRVQEISQNLSKWMGNNVTIEEKYFGESQAISEESDQHRRKVDIEIVKVVN